MPQLTSRTSELGNLILSFSFTQHRVTLPFVPLLLSALTDNTLTPHCRRRLRCSCSCCFRVKSYRAALSLRASGTANARIRLEHPTSHFAHRLTSLVISFGSHSLHSPSPGGSRLTAYCLLAWITLFYLDKQSLYYIAESRTIYTSGQA